MIVWVGSIKHDTAPTKYNSGARYYPIAMYGRQPLDCCSCTSLVDTAVWTGNQMIVLGRLGQHSQSQYWWCVYLRIRAQPRQFPAQLEIVNDLSEMVFDHRRWFLQREAGRSRHGGFPLCRRLSSPPTIPQYSEPDDGQTISTPSRPSTSAARRLEE